MIAPLPVLKAIDRAGFTLVELSIVLVIIGLIIGGIVVGRDLINTAAIRAQISQIEKYQTAVNTFRGKYGYLPGDIPDPVASGFGFKPRGQYAGGGDGNGLIQGVQCTGYTPAGSRQGTGETTMVWVDLSTAGLIDGGFSAASANSNMNSNTSDVVGASIGLYFPPAKIGQGNYVYAWSDGPNVGQAAGANNLNYFGVSLVSSILDCSDGGGIYWVGWSNVNENVGLTVAQAYTIDTKIDDGLPTTGRVIAAALTYGAQYSGWASYSLGSSIVTPISPSSTSCLDNAGNIANTAHYSMSVSNGSNIDCALSFQFQ